MDGVPVPHASEFWLGVFLEVNQSLCPHGNTPKWLFSSKYCTADSRNIFIHMDNRKRPKRYSNHVRPCVAKSSWNSKGSGKLMCVLLTFVCSICFIISIFQYIKVFFVVYLAFYLFILFYVQDICNVDQSHCCHINNYNMIVLESLYYTKYSY